MDQSQRKIGVAIVRLGPSDQSSADVLASIERAESMGIHAVWLTTAMAGPDPLTILAAAAVRTQSILLGTAIVPTYPRHPLAMAQQVQVVAQLAPGRFRLGVGPSHQPIMEGTFGLKLRAPLGHLSEYLHILKALLQGGSVEFDGRHYKAHATIASPVDVPVMASALGPKAFELCGAEADGALPWVCPAVYLSDVGLPAMKAGAERAGRPVPPLIAHAPVCVHDSPEEVRAAVREQIMNPQLVFYQRMFAAAGFPEASSGTWSDAMIEGTVLSGSEAVVAEKLEGLLAIGAAEVMALPVTAGSARAASLDRTMRLLGQVAQSIKT